MPTTFNSSLRGSISVAPGAYPERGTADPDDYSGGFGVWSGTSFSAPAFVGDLACLLVDSPLDRDAGKRVTALRSMVDACIAKRE